MKFQIADVPGRAVSPLTAAAGAHGVAHPTITFRPSPFVLCFPRAFTLIEVMVVMGLLSLIVLALMAVFNSTQTAFRASITQTDVLEGGRATMDLMTSDLGQMTASGGSCSYSLFNVYYTTNPVNFYANTNWDYYQPLRQPLPGSGARRTNVLENYFVLSRGSLNGSPAWFGVGYAVNLMATSDLNPLYRFYMATNIQASPNPAILFNTFMSSVLTGSFTNSNWSHLLDGVVDLRVRAFDPNGVWMTNYYGFYSGQTVTNKNTSFLSPAWGEVGFYMFSNTLPASVEIQLGVLEDRALRRAGTWPNGSLLQSNYLAQQAGAVHVFRQRVTIPNVDLSAYQ